MNNQIQKKSANFDLSSLELLDLGEDARFPEEKPAVETDGEKYILFFLDTEIYAVLSRQVAEIFQPLAITPLPNTPLWLTGIANFRNEIISVIDLQQLWGKQSLSISPKAKLIVLRPENSDCSVAFTIDKLSEVVRLSDRNIQPVSDQTTPYIYGQTTHKSNTLHLLDTGKLVSSLSF